MQLRPRTAFSRSWLPHAGSRPATAAIMPIPPLHIVPGTVPFSLKQSCSICRRAPQSPSHPGPRGPRLLRGGPMAPSWAWSVGLLALLGGRSAAHKAWQEVEVAVASRSESFPLPRYVRQPRRAATLPSLRLCVHRHIHPPGNATTSGQPAAVRLRLDGGDEVPREGTDGTSAITSELSWGFKDTSPWPQLWSRCRHCTLRPGEPPLYELQAELFDPTGTLRKAHRGEGRPVLSSSKWHGFFHSQTEEVCACAFLPAVLSALLEPCRGA
jgi:hypothetical protein